MKNLYHKIIEDDIKSESIIDNAINYKPKKEDKRIIRMAPLNDSNGDYYPICKNERHKGIISADESKKCKNKRNGKGCEYFAKAYLE